MMRICSAGTSTLLLFVVLIVTAGCGGDSTTDTDKKGDNPDSPASAKFNVSDLKAVGIAFHNHHDRHGKGPDSWEGLLETAGADEKAAIESVRKAGYQMKWGVSIRDAVEGTTNFVLAESPNHPQKLYLDGSVR